MSADTITTPVFVKLSFTVIALGSCASTTMADTNKNKTIAFFINPPACFRRFGEAESCFS